MLELGTPRAITGIRPTGDLSVGNYVGAIQPIMDLQQSFEGPINLFVADVHGLTDQEPSLISSVREDTVRWFLAAGVDPERAILYLQSQVEGQTVTLENYLGRHVKMARLMRVPNLKESLKTGEDVEQASLALASYPVLMGADILLQDAVHVPVGKDQRAHVELIREIARDFNKTYGKGEPVVVVPDLVEAAKEVRIVALNGKGKMSKSEPDGAIFLKDTADEVARKIKRAKTALTGTTSDELESHLLLSERLAGGPEHPLVVRLQDTYARHMDGKRVMGDFKGIMTEIAVEFLGGIQDRYASITETDVRNVLLDGGEKAATYADQTLLRVQKAMGFVTIRRAMPNR